MLKKFKERLSSLSGEMGDIKKTLIKLVEIEIKWLK